jgi:hypothetical protein
MPIIYHQYVETNRYGFWHLLLDFILTLCTGGLWLLWIFIRFLRSNTH